MIVAFSARSGGFFVEVDANEPRIRSQTYDLERTSWTIGLIEPQRDLGASVDRTPRASVRGCLHIASERGQDFRQGPVRNGAKRPILRDS